MDRTIKRLSLSLFGRFSTLDAFQRLHQPLQASGMNMLLKTYASMIMFAAVLAGVCSFAGMVFYSYMFAFPLDVAITFIITLPLISAFGTFAFLYYYPAQRATTIRKSIETDLPFATTHMAALASSGIPPEAMFELLAGFAEYKGIASQASIVVRNMQTFGMSSVAAIADAAKRTPSAEFRQLLNGISFTVEKGGNLSDYLKQMSEKALFDFRINRDKHLKTLSTYADIYTALLVAAPLMMLSLLGILSVIGGQIVGFSIGELITILTFGMLPFLNITFLAFIHLTYSGI